MDMDKNIVNIIIIAIIASVVLFSGCVEEETTPPTETPAVTPTPTPTPEPEMESHTIISTPTPTPEATATPRATIEPPNVTLKPGYKWYQDDEFGFRIGYPEDWDKSDVGLSEGQESSIMFGPPGSLDDPLKYHEEGGDYVQIAVIVCSDLERTPQAKILESHEYEELKKQGLVSKYGEVTINGRKGYEVIRPAFSTYKVTIVVFEVDDFYYVINIWTGLELYDNYEDTFEDVINSFIIE